MQETKLLAKKNKLVEQETKLLAQEYKVEPQEKNVLPTPLFHGKICRKSRIQIIFTPMKLRIYILFTIVILSATWSNGQTPAVPEYVRLYKTGQYATAASQLKKVVKKAPADPDAWNYLGLSQTALKKDKDAIKAFEKAVKLKPQEAVFRGNLAYAYYLQNDRRAASEARETVRLDPNVASGHLVLAAIAILDEFYGVAYEHANKAIALDPDLADAYILKAKTLLGNHFLRTRAIKQTEYNKAATFKEAAEALEKYVNLRQNDPDTAGVRQELFALKAIAEDHARTDAENRKNEGSSDTDSLGKIPYKILRKPLARYSTEGRQKGVSGTVRVMVQLREDGKIGHVLVVKPLGYGLDQQVMAAARSIEFTPATKNGKPISVFVTIEYGFHIF